MVEILNKIKIGIVEPLCKPKANNVDNKKNNETNFLFLIYFSFINNLKKSGIDTDNRTPNEIACLNKCWLR